jgi:hypothetical protein
VFMPIKMQNLNWYYNRLKAMSPSEVIWRMQSCLRDNTDRLLVKRRQQSRTLSALLNGDGESTEPGFCVTDINKKTETGGNKSILARAEMIAENRLSFFDLKDKFLGDPIIWNRDHKIGKDTPTTFSSSIDYRDIKETGDCKYVWEPNRHHQLVVLARAYCLSKDERFAKTAAEQIESWLDQNPYGIGMNWRSGLELGIRLINLVWALDLIRQSKAVNKALYLRIMDSVSRHIWEIDRKYSRGSSVNNHLIGEAAGVFIASSYFKNLRNASKWRQKARDILIREIINQTYQDGGTKEQARGYHFFVLQFFTIAGITARAVGQDMPQSYWSRLEKMFEFIGCLSEGGDNIPVFGDCDDGYVLDLGQNPHDIKEWLAVGAVLFNRSDFKVWAGDRTEILDWLPVESARQTFYSIAESESKTLCSMAFNESGYYLLQYGKRDSTDRINVLFDCGTLGMGALAAHGHADALSFTLRAFERDILVDPGTYDYFSYPAWREYFRSTRAHNTLVIDENNQSEISGLFLWGRKANAKCLEWQPNDYGGTVAGEHDGYTSLNDPVIHRRSLKLDSRQKKLFIKDEIICSEEHKIEIYFHLSEYCKIIKVIGNSFFIDAGAGGIILHLDGNFMTEEFFGSENPICGWISRGYHQKVPAKTIVGKCIHKGNLSLESIIEIGLPKCVTL